MKFYAIGMLFCLALIACGKDTVDEIDLTDESYNLYDASGQLMGMVEFKDNGSYVLDKYDFLNISDYPESVGFVQTILGQFIQEGEMLILNDQVRAEIGLINRWGAPVSSSDRLLYEKSDAIIAQLSGEIFTTDCHRVIVEGQTLIEL